MRAHMAAGERRPMGSAYANPGGRLGAAACRPGARPPMRPKRPNCPWQSARTTATALAAPAWIACAACATAAHTPPPPRAGVNRGRDLPATGAPDYTGGMSLPSRAELEAIAARAGAQALRHFRRVTAERKADRTLVTAADREVEAALVAELGALLPDAGILGEEGAAREGRGPYRIVLDPIDGTAAFVAGLATWCVCIGILEGARPVAGVVHLPCLDETYAAVGGAAWLNGAPLASLGDTGPVGDRFIVTHAHAHRRHRITYPGKVRSLEIGRAHV